MSLPKFCAELDEALHPDIEPDILGDRNPVDIIISKTSIVSREDISPDQREYVKEVVKCAEGRWFGDLFDRMFATMFEAMPSPQTEEFRHHAAHPGCVT